MVAAMMAAQAMSSAVRMGAKTTRRAVTLSLLLAVVGASKTALAYRPFDGTDADVASQGDFELELGPVHWYAGPIATSAGGQGTGRYVIAPATVLNLGFAPGWEFVGDLQNFVTIDGAPGQPVDRLLETDVFLKTVVIRGSMQDAGPAPSLAVEFGPLLPNINGDEAFGASLNVIVSQRWKDFTVHLNDWAQLTRGDLQFDWFTGVILEGPFDAPVRPVSELFVEHEWRANVTTWSALAGAIWRVREGFDLDVGLRVARVGDERASEVRLGFTWAVGVWGK
jgi:hypothetical protein